MTIQRALLLVGSAKPSGQSASEALLTFLAKQLQAHGVETELERVVHYSHRPEALFEAIERAELFVLASPVYIDALPYLVVQACERIAAHRQQLTAPDGKRFAAVVNCGFPETAHCDTTLRIAKLFARDAEFEWAGGLGMGAGQPLSGHPVEDNFPHGRFAAPALTQAAAALAEGQAIPQRAVDLMATPTMPRFMYMMLGGSNWRKQAWDNGVLTQLHDKPYASEP